MVRLTARRAAMTLLLVVLILVTGCGSVQPTPTSVPATSAAEAATVAPPPTSTTSPTQPPTPTIPPPVESPTAEPTPSLPPATPTTAQPSLASEPLVIDAPLAPPPILDGTLSPDEWSAARVEQFSDGSELLLMHDGQYLYVGIRAAAEGLGSICLDGGNEVSVLHSSAALGTAVYVKAEDGWQPIRDFVWTCRNPGDTQRARDERARHLEREQWLANIVYMGDPQEMEYQIAMPEGSLRLAVNYLKSSRPPSAATWPVGLDDDCQKLELLQGNMPSPLEFSPETWVTVVASAAGEATTGGGEIAFYSERDGNAEIYLINADGSGEQRLTDNDADDICPAWSPDGTRLAFLSDRHDPEPVSCFPECHYELYVMEADGSGQQRLTDNNASELHPAWSPDGVQIAFVSDRDGDQEIYVVDVDGGDPRRLTDSPGGDMRPVWSPDGQQILFNSERDGNWELYVMNADGSDQQRLTDSPSWELFPAWSPDGTRIAFFLMRDGSGRQDLYVMNADGTGMQQLTDHPAVDEDPAWSPDGAQIVFQSDRDGNFEIYVMNADGSDQQRVTQHPGGDYWPAWRPAPMDAAAPVSWQGDYFGQTPPGLTPEIFGPGFISTDDFEFAGTFSPDGTEFFFTRRPATDGRGLHQRIWHTLLQDGGWTEPQLAPFTYDAFEFEPHISPDGQKLFYGSRRPGGGSGDMHIWVVQRAAGGWGEPEPLDWPLSDAFAMYVTSTRDGTLYVTGQNGIYRSPWLDGQYQPVELLGDEINHLLLAAHPFIAPDESYLIFDAQPANDGRSSLYISFRQADGTWTMAQKMGEEINANASQLAASVSPDGKYLFFTRVTAGNADIYWVDATVIDAYRP